MKRHGREFTPREKPVQKIELSEKYIKPRGMLALLLLILGIALIGYGLMSALTTEPTWQTIEASTGGEASCAGDFRLMYDFSDAGSDATAMKKTLTNLYSQAVVSAWRSFSADLMEEGLGNVAWLNAHVNEPVTLEPGLYRALEQVVSSGDRQIFLAPAAEQYRHVFTSLTDSEAENFDPGKNPEVGAWFSELAAFVSDPEAIGLTLLGENRAELSVSEAYLAFARENEITRFLDFGWMVNAFLADELAWQLTQAGFTTGYLTSSDGFVRNLDTRGNEYYVNLTAGETAMVTPGELAYTAPGSFVLLRRFSLEPGDRYTYASGETVTPYLTAADCRSRAATESLLAYSAQATCGQLLLQVTSLYTADTLDPGAISALTASGTYAVWCAQGTVFCNDPAADIRLTENGGYTLQKVD